MQSLSWALFVAFEGNRAHLQIFFIFGLKRFMKETENVLD